MVKSKESLSRNLESGLGEIQLFIVFLFMTFIIIFISLFITIVNYNIVIEDILSDLSLRMEKRANIYSYDDQSLQDIFVALKEEYRLDIEELYEEKIVSKKISEEIINKLCFGQVMINDDRNQIYNHKIYSISINIEDQVSTCKLPLIFFDYLPRKYNYVILREYNSY
jgi:hypothetical protein